MTDINEVSLSDVGESDANDWDGWTIDVRQSHPFDSEEMEGMNAEASLAAYLSDTEGAVLRGFPGARVYVNAPPSEPSGIRILVIGPIMVEPDGSNAAMVLHAEEDVEQAVKHLMDEVWERGDFWVEAK